MEITTTEEKNSFENIDVLNPVSITEALRLLKLLYSGTQIDLELINQNPDVDANHLHQRAAWQFYRQLYIAIIEQLSGSFEKRVGALVDVFNNYPNTDKHYQAFITFFFGKEISIKSIEEASNLVKNLMEKHTIKERADEIEKLLLKFIEYIDPLHGVGKNTFDPLAFYKAQLLKPSGIFLEESFESVKEILEILNDAPPSNLLQLNQALKNIVDKMTLILTPPLQVYPPSEMNCRFF